MHLQVVRSAFFINNFEPKPDSILSKGKVKQVGFIITRININVEKEHFMKNILQVEDEKNYYHAEDFEIGQTVDIAGRSILIHDCDGFTKKFFKTNYDKGTD